MNSMMVNSTIMSTMLYLFMYYMFTNHPMTFAMLTLTQSIFMASLISFNMKYSYFSFFIFIIYLGGILMLFSYIISLISSSKPFLENKSNDTLIMSFISYWCYEEIKLNDEEMYLDSSMMKFENLIQSSFSTSSMKFSIYLMIFLLLIMVMVIFITDTSKGTMRKI